MSLVLVYNNLTRAATMPIEKAMSVPSLIVRRCSIWIKRASTWAKLEPISRRNTSISRCRSSLVTNSLRLTSSASAKTSASASACLSGTPAALSRLAYFKVSKVMAAMVVPSQFNSSHSLAQGFNK